MTILSLVTAVANRTGKIIKKWPRRLKRRTFFYKMVY